MNTPIFIASETGYGYSRPCFDGDGKKIIFMRKSLDADAPPVGLYTVPAEIIEPPVPPSQYYQPAYGTIDATRPDWCWETGQVALTGTPVIGPSPPSSLWVIDNGPNSGARGRCRSRLQVPQAPRSKMESTIMMWPMSSILPGFRGEAPSARPITGPIRRSKCRRRPGNTPP